MNPFLSGTIFEEEVCSSLSYLDFGKLLIPKPLFSKELNKNTQIDAIFITNYCVYSIEIKSAHKLSGNLEDTCWWSSTFNNSKMTCVMNPYAQNMKHILAMKLHLFRKGMKYVPFQNVIVVKDDSIIKSDCNNIYTIQELCRKLVEEFRKNSVKTSIINMDKVYNVLK